MILIISLLIAFLVVLLLFLIIRSKASGNQMHQRIRDLQSAKSHAEEMERMPFMERTVRPASIFRF